jgi:hypothetical protein
VDKPQTRARIDPKNLEQPQTQFPLSSFSSCLLCGEHKVTKTTKNDGEGVEFVVPGISIPRLVRVLVKKRACRNRLLGALIPSMKKLILLTTVFSLALVTSTWAGDDKKSAAPDAMPACCAAGKDAKTAKDTKASCGTCPMQGVAAKTTKEVRNAKGCAGAEGGCCSGAPATAKDAKTTAKEAKAAKKAEKAQAKAAKKADKTARQN